MKMFLELLALCKIKVVMLLLLTALVGMLLATPSPPDAQVLIFALLGIGTVAASAATFNHVLDQALDAKMERTRKRPLPGGRVSTRFAIAWGAVLMLIGLWVLYQFVNSLTAYLTFAALLGYALIYTLYLKYATPQNIVIGGIAGAAPPVLGWAAVTGTIETNALLLFLIIFVWTPPHFWALAVHRQEDYKKANVPMLPITHGPIFTRVQILLYTILLIPVTVMPYLVGMSSWIYLGSIVLLNAYFLTYAIRLYRQKDNDSVAMPMFVFSIQYLALLFLALVVDHYIFPQWSDTLGVLV